MHALPLVRRLVFAMWLSLVAAVLAAILVSHLAPLLGHRVVIIRGASMSPAIPLGALLLEQPVDAALIRPGDVVTMLTGGSVVVTHRVVRVVAEAGALMLETKGDANGQPDPALVPATSVVGIVRASVPIAGFVVAFLTIPSGVLCVISMIGSLLALLWLLEAYEADDAAAEVREGPTTVAVADAPAS